jgi:uncharacterized OB-fold protein
MPTYSDSEIVTALPRTRIDQDNRDFYSGWLERQLVLNRCSDCGAWRHPPRSICSACWSTRIEPTPVSGRGRVYMVTCLYQGPVIDGIDYSQGYPVATVELEEERGLRYTGAVIDCNPEEVVIGMPVELQWIEREGAPFPVFRPAERG